MRRDRSDSAAPAVHALWVVISGFVSVVTVGVVPLVYASGVKNRKGRYTDLFRRGEFTRGFILSAEKGALYATFKYEFDIAGSTYIAFMEYAVEMTRFWGEGDTVPVLYDPHDPTQCCFVYR